MPSGTPVMHLVQFAVDLYEALEYRRPEGIRLGATAWARWVGDLKEHWPHAAGDEHWCEIPIALDEALPIDQVACDPPSEQAALAMTEMAEIAVLREQIAT